MKGVNFLKNLSLWMAISLLAGFTSCKDSDDEEWIIDYNPVYFVVSVENAHGDNLLNPAVEGNIIGDNNYIVVDGNQEAVQSGWYWIDEPMASSRAYKPTWFGAYIASSMNYSLDGNPDDNRIYIGEFDGGYNGEQSATLTLSGRSYTLSFTNSTHLLDVERHFYLDGVEQESGNYTIVL